MRFKTLAIFLLLTGATAFAQTDTCSQKGEMKVIRDPQGNQQTAKCDGEKFVVTLERSALEQKGYDDAIADAQKKHDKEAADAKKAQAELEAKKRSQFVTYTAVERAQQDMLFKAGSAKVKEAKKLIVRAQKLQAELAAVNKQLEALSQQIVAVEKVTADGK